MPSHPDDTVVDRMVDRSERQGLLPRETSASASQRRGVSIRRRQHDARLRRALLDDDDDRPKDAWMRPYWLGLGLFLALLCFWVLDTLKDVVFGALVTDAATENALQEYQPTAKLVSVCTTLALVCLLEYIQQQQAEERRRQRVASEEYEASDVMDPGGTWQRMGVHTTSRRYGDDTSAPLFHTSGTARSDDSSHMFAMIGVPYCIFFGLAAYLLQFHPATRWTHGAASATGDTDSGWDSTMSTNTHHFWLILGYAWYAAIESFGSLMVATFWSYANSTLTLDDAKAYYGTIIAFAQTGAICGSTIVTLHVWNAVTLVVTACLVLVLHILCMTMYSRRFGRVHHEDNGDDNEIAPLPVDTASRSPTTINASSSPMWLGVHLILKHNYVLLILGVSCLYEVSLTCMNYQMTLLGWSRFEESSNYGNNSMSFTQFMGHYGQMVNLSSLLFSSMVFPLLMRHVGLKYTLRLFPTFLVAANLLAWSVPGNLGILFVSMSLLKAITYSIHDPAKEILYIPTSHAIQYQAKFWIDVVGARLAKAIGSSINHVSGNLLDVPTSSTQHSATRAAATAATAAPSLVTAVALWYVCYRVGSHFEGLVATNTMVGVNDGGDDNREYCADDSTECHSVEHDDDGEGAGDGRGRLVEQSHPAMELTAL